MASRYLQWNLSIKKFVFFSVIREILSRHARCSACNVTKSNIPLRLCGLVKILWSFFITLEFFYKISFEFNTCFNLINVHTFLLKNVKQIFINSIFLLKYSSV